MINKISNKDKEDWENFLSGKEKLTNKDQEIQKQDFSKKRLIDLHGYALNEANEEIEKFIKKAFDDQIGKLIIVTGKGIHSKNEEDPYVSKKLGILKYSIPDFLKNNKDLSRMIKSLAKAKTEDGGEGAFYIYLRKKK